MTKAPVTFTMWSAAFLLAGFALGRATGAEPVAHAQTSARVFELRTYTAPPGKLADLQARFRNHTLRIFQKHGMTNIGYWTPQDAPLSQNTLVYLLAYPSRDAAKESWAAFRADPEWKKVSAESEVNGRIIEKVESVFLDPTDYSPIK